MGLTENGVSTTKEKGQFAYEEYGPYYNRKIQWDYRDNKGVLHSGISRTLAMAILEAAKKSGEKINPTKIRECN